ncbi:MAG: hypothetical protein DRP65_09015 [Planctomycetota bacterium]|nr:MAG: hypothetical protein DRP65_09015 [Planctomycetota bacterium]
MWLETGNMEDKQKRQIAQFVKDTTNLVTEWGFDAGSMQKELLQLHKIIGQLIQERFRTKGAAAKAELAELESQARKCRKLIVQRSLTAH